MNFNRILIISFIVLMLSSYETDSTIFSILAKLLMLKGVLFMSMPLSIGAFVMGQGMGFFAGNMMGGYMMMRAAHRYHVKEKSKWVQHSNWHGPPYYTNTYQKGYEKGKAIVDALNAGQQKFNAIASIFKPKGLGWKAPAPPKPVYGPPHHHHHHPHHSTAPIVLKTPGGWKASAGYDFSYGSFSNPAASVQPAPHSNYGAPPPPSSSYGIPPPPSHPHSPSGGPYGAPEPYQEYYPGGNRKHGFSSILSSIADGKHGDEDANSIRRATHDDSESSRFYTSAYGTPGQEFTGILTNEPTTEGGKYLRGDMASASSSSPGKSGVTTAPNEILETYLEQRLKAEAEKEKDSERKQEAQQLVQMLRKAYLKQLVDSLKEEETKTASNRQLHEHQSLSSSIESLFGSRDSRSVEQRNNNEVGGGNVGVSPATQKLIRDLLVNQVFTESAELTKDNNEKLDTAEVETITEKILSLTSMEREELIKGLDEIEGGGGGSGFEETGSGTEYAEGGGIAEGT